MANLPETRTKESTELTRKLTPNERSIYTAIRMGYSLKDLAKKAYPSIKGNKKQLRDRMDFLIRLEGLLATSEPLQLAVSNASQANLIQSLPTVTEAVAGRATRTGRADIVKLVFEASGSHNPHIKHEHSGDIEIKLSMPRPEAAGLPYGDKPSVDSTARPVKTGRDGTPMRGAPKEAD